MRPESSAVVIKTIAWFVRHLRPVAVLSALVVGLAITDLMSGAAPAQQACPQSAPGAPSSGTPGAQQQLVPSGPVSLTLCRYRGLNDPTPTYVNQIAGSATVTDPMQLQSLEDQFNALPPPQSGTFACPADDGSSLLARFDHPNSPSDEVLIRTTGCSDATNGYVTASMAFNGGQQLRTELQNLTGCASSIDDWLCNSDPVPTNPNSGSSTGNPPPAPSTHPPTPNATVSGFVRLCRGPALARRCLVDTIRMCRPPNGCMTPDRIALLDTAGRRVAVRKLHHARFRLSVGPGRYTIELLGNSKRIHGHFVRSKRITATADWTIAVVFTFSIP